MKAANDTVLKDAWRGTCRRLSSLRDWPANGNSPYSPVFCLSLIVGVGLIIEFGR